MHSSKFTRSPVLVTINKQPPLPSLSRLMTVTAAPGGCFGTRRILQAVCTAGGPEDGQVNCGGSFIHRKMFFLYFDCFCVYSVKCFWMSWRVFFGENKHSQPADLFFFLVLVIHKFKRGFYKLVSKHLLSCI